MTTINNIPAFKLWHDLPEDRPIDWLPALIVGYANLARHLKIAFKKNSLAWILVNMPLEILIVVAAAAFYQRTISKWTLDLVHKILFRLF